MQKLLHERGRSALQLHKTSAAESAKQWRFTSILLRLCIQCRIVNHCHLAMSSLTNWIIMILLCPRYHRQHQADHRACHRGPCHRGRGLGQTQQSPLSILRSPVQLPDQNNRSLLKKRLINPQAGKTLEEQVEMRPYLRNDNQALLLFLLLTVKSDATFRVPVPCCSFLRIMLSARTSCLQTIQTLIA